MAFRKGIRKAIFVFCPSSKGKTREGETGPPEAGVCLFRVMLPQQRLITGIVVLNYFVQIVLVIYLTD